MIGDRQNNKLINHLHQISRSEVIRIEAVRTVDLSVESDVLKFCALQGFMPSAPVIGCALAHKQVYNQMIKFNQNIALVFEDDALPIENFDFDKFTKVVIEFEKLSNPSICLLYFKYGSKQKNIQTIIKYKFIPSYAVAYLINYDAASTLNLNQNPISEVADWPKEPKGINYYHVQMPFYKHGTSDFMMTSTIEPLRGKLKLRTKIEFYTFAWYLKNTKYFKNIREYWRMIVKARLDFHFTRKYKVEN